MYDAVVVGLGGMGSAALANLARAGARVAGYDRFARGHAFGASNGRSRLIRKAYFEDPSYVPLLRRAYDAWEELERRANVRLLHRIGLLLAGTPDSAIVVGAQRSASQYGLAIEMLDAAAIRARFRAFAPRDDEIGVYERDAGYLVPEAAIEAFLDVAADNGAALHFETPAAGWERTKTGVRVRFRSPGTPPVEGRRLILAAGSWFREFDAGFAMPIVLQRNVQSWFRAMPPSEDHDAVPAFLVNRAELPGALYGVPDGYGLKAAFHRYGATVASPDAFDRSAGAAELRGLETAVSRWIPGVAPGIVDARPCLYDVTPDERFVVGFHPHEPRVVVAGGFSGHGFKFASVMGEVLAGLALEGGTPYDLDFVSPNRFCR